MRNLQKHQPLQKKKTRAYQEWFWRTNEIFPSGAHLLLRTVWHRAEHKGHSQVAQHPLLRTVRHRAEHKGHSQVAQHPLLRTVRHRAREWKKICTVNTFVFKQNAAQSREPYEYLINLYTVQKIHVRIFLCIPDEGYRMYILVWKEPVFYFQTGFNSHTVTKDPWNAY